MAGGGNHGADLRAIYYRVHGEHLGWYDDNLELGGDIFPPNHGAIIIGVNDPIVRRQLAWRFKNLQAAKPLIDPSAIIGPDVTIGHGSVVAPGVIMLRDVMLGQHCHVNYSASMTRCTVGDFTSIAPAATICGNVTIGQECVIGAGATVCERSTIGNGCVIGAGAIVLPYGNVPDCTTVTGVWKQ